MIYSEDQSHCQFATVSKAEMDALDEGVRGGLYGPGKLHGDYSDDSLRVLADGSVVVKWCVAMGDPLDGLGLSVSLFTRDQLLDHIANQGGE